MYININEKRGGKKSTKEGPKTGLAAAIQI